MRLRGCSMPWLRRSICRALYCGSYMSAVARMEWAGVPLDVPRLELLRRHWEGLQDVLIAEIDEI